MGYFIFHFRKGTRVPTLWTKLGGILDRPEEMSAAWGQKLVWVVCESS